MANNSRSRVAASIPDRFQIADSAPDRCQVANSADDRLRVGVVITRLAGGAGVLALHGIRAAAVDPYRTTLIAGQADPRLLTRAHQAGIEVVLEPALRAPIAPLADPVALYRLTALLRQREFDVVHTHCAKAGTLARLAARRAGVPRVVHTYHGFPFHPFQSPARRAAYVGIERMSGRHTDIALCVGSGVAAEAIARRLIAPDRVRTIGVVVDGNAPQRDPRTSTAARAALGLPRDAVVVGAVGRLTFQKAPEDFVTMLAALGRPNVVGVWIGGGELADRVSHMVSGLPNVRLVLAGERADVPALLPALDVFALPSRYEGLPTVVVEAMVAGVPVVATAVNAVPDVVQPGQTGLLVAPRRPDLLADAVRALLDRPEWAAELAGNARARLGDRFTRAALLSAVDMAYSTERMHRPAVFAAR